MGDTGNYLWRFSVYQFCSWEVGYSMEEGIFLYAFVEFCLLLVISKDPNSDEVGNYSLSTPTFFKAGTWKLVYLLLYFYFLHALYHILRSQGVAHQPTMHFILMRSSEEKSKGSFGTWKSTQPTNPICYNPVPGKDAFYNFQISIRQLFHCH